LAIEALKRDLCVLSRVTHRLLNDLHAARATGSHPRLLVKVLAADLLLLDDFGLHPLSPQSAQDFYDIISVRYEPGSLIITSLSCRTDRAIRPLRNGPKCSGTTGTVPARVWPA
jgi:DNA replication protein DnaC